MEENRAIFPDDDITLIVKKYEQMLKNNENYFFDVAEFESIIDYYLENNDVNFAFEASESANIQHPHSVSLQLRHSKVLIDKGRATDALKAIKVLEQIEPDNFEIYIIKGAALGMLGDANGSKRNFDLALEVDPEEEVSVLMSIISVLYNLNSYKTLLQYLHKLISLEPNYETHLYDLAYAYEKLEDYENAIKYYVLFLNKVPFADNAWYNLGILYSKTNRLNKALESYDYALAVNPENIFALFNKGNILSGKGKYSKALDIYLEYLEYENESPEALTYAAECFHKTGEKNMAQKYFKMAINIDPVFAEPWFGLGMICLQDLQHKECLFYFKKAIEYDSDNPEFYYYFGKAQIQLNDHKGAVRSFMIALKIDPFYDEVWSDLGLLVISEGLFKRVIPMLEKALKVTGDIHGLRFILSSAYLYSGEKVKCYHHLSKAFVLSEDSFPIFKNLFPTSLLTDEIKELVLLKD